MEMAYEPLIALEEIAPISPLGANASTEPQNYAVAGSRAFAFAPPNRLYRTDGTADGTALVSRMIPEFITAPKMTVFKDRVYWVSGKSVWMSDGTGAGTKEFWRSSDDIFTLFVFDGALYISSLELFRSDGSAAPVLVSPLAPITPPFIAGGKAYYLCITSQGFQFCVSDGTGGGTRVLGTSRTTIDDRPILLGEINGYLLVSARFSQARRGLWSLDLATGSLGQLLTAGTADVIAAAPQPIAVLGTFAYFPCVTGAGNELCRSDGTEAGTSVLDLAATGSSDPAVIALPDRLVIRARQPARGTELYVSDGTLAGTTPLPELVAGVGDGVSQTRLIRVGNAVYFGATRNGGSDLAKTDGTAAGTLVLRKEVALILHPLRSAFDLEDAIALGDRLLFTASHPDTRYEPWISDGTEAGTKLVKDLIGPVGRTSFDHVVKGGVNGGYCLLTTMAPTTSFRSIYATDGTAANTRIMAADVRALAASNSAMFFALPFGPGELLSTNCLEFPPRTVMAPSPLFTKGASVNNKLIFLGPGQSTFSVPWFSDGTAAGTKISALSGSNFLQAVGDKIWMAVGVLGEELWVSDGTEAGTKLVKNLRAGALHAVTMDSFTPLGGKTLFVASDGSTGRELWHTDGTTSGTSLLIELVPGATGAEPRDLVPWRSEVMFHATNAAGARSLWRTDGTAAGTKQVKEVSPVSPLVVWGEYVFFAAAGADGTELWRSDGTAAGTVQVADLHLGPSSSNPGELLLKSPQGPLFFAAEVPAVGRELWLLAEPLGSPELAMDFAPGADWSSPKPLYVHNGSLVVYAESDHRGKLWRTPATPPEPAPATPPEEEDESGCACATASSGAGALVPGMLVLLSLMARRRRQRPGARVG